MTVGNSIAKAIWHNPGENKSFSIADAEGEDEFIIAPFMKNGKIVSIRGVIAETNQQSMIRFFKEIKLAATSEKHTTSKAHYIKSVENAILAIKNDRFEKVVLARQYFLEKEIDLQTLFLQLVKKYPNAFAYCFLSANGTCMIGATPETLLVKNDNDLLTEALGGTEQTNGYGKKEYDEHRQIITDIINKLNATGYDFNQSETTVKIAGNVSHLSTLFNVKSKSLAGDLSLLHALHPTSAVCGLPFQPAYDFLIEQEDFERNYYAGYLGIINGSDFDFHVNLRCAEIFDSAAILYAGAGINKDSIAENEWQETSDKLGTLLNLME